MGQGLADALFRVTLDHRGPGNVSRYRRRRQRTHVDRGDRHARRAKSLSQEGQLLTLRVRRGDGVDGP